MEYKILWSGFAISEGFIKFFRSAIKKRIKNHNPDSGASSTYDNEQPKTANLAAMAPDTHKGDSMDKLKFCPFCGGTEIRLSVYDKNGWWEPTIICELCGVGFTTGLYGGGIDILYVEEHISEAWDRRSDQD